MPERTWLIRHSRTGQYVIGFNKTQGPIYGDRAEVTPKPLRIVQERLAQIRSYVETHPEAGTPGSFYITQL